MRFEAMGRVKPGTGAMVPAVAAILVCGLGAQAGRPSLPNCGAGPREPNEPASPSRILRDIPDPATGEHWLLVADPAHPGGPGRMVMAVCGWESGPASTGKQAAVIHPGDKIIVEEHTPSVEARLEAVALEPAAAGSGLNVRLKIGRKVVRAVAVAPGRVALAK
ncbi:MAG TPA: hypothetical protein VGS58_08950 [Candidatus Sulfopaludibacter sp.]|nr:hypothetical protein [Candidatus Sulfopaludibacter sp.]